jgi:hypothetical protein
MKREEIQKLIAEAYKLGCEQGRGEYRISVNVETTNQVEKEASKR